MRHVIKSAMLAVALLFNYAASAQDTGTLVVEVAQFTSEKELPKKVDKQLRNGGLEWGVKDTQMVFSMVAKQFVDHPINHLTRYGQSEALTLPTGTYHVTGIGLEMTTGFSVQKILDKGAYVNENVLTFTIEPGKTTTLAIKPVIHKDATFAVNFWMPTLMASVRSEAGTGTETALNTRGASSIAWPNYNGPLKFVAK
ncbi:hypothetical protein JI752_005180 [Lysobacter sp. MMG2]|uniref:hypothetical protein n=1 Tax=Lysobacter sp. MMG2 TaxID=2801338 RepID=UPI001C24E934|nr:hypothetical protein [Lysobacter sp. MMG2]MBU8975527.1 hypothetical protein [Lysobacter sp. MMG2]